MSCHPQPRQVLLWDEARDGGLGAFSSGIRPRRATLQEQTLNSSAEVPALCETYQSLLLRCPYPQPAGLNTWNGILRILPWLPRTE